MPVVFIGYGSNMRGRLQWIEMGRELLEDVLGPAQKSPIYETNPVGEGLSRWFLNGVWMFMTDLDPQSLLGLLQRVEKECGRESQNRSVTRGTEEQDRIYEDRTLDLDLLLYGNQVLEEPDLIVPHPRMHLRKFVLWPLANLVPGLRHPLTNKTISELLQEGDFQGQELRGYP